MSDTTTAPGIKDGDIFRWRYKNEKPEHRREWGRYHCRSQIAVAKDGWLADTFWGSRSDGTAMWPCDEAREILVLEKLGNLSEVEKRPEYEAMYYDDADIVDINHSNSSRGNFYVRKGADRSRHKMIQIAAEKAAAAERERDSALSKIERYKQALADLAAGKPLEEVYL